MAVQQWELTAEQRAVTVERITASISNLAFAQGVALSLGDARKAAATAEKKAHTVAQVESRTTTGARPEAESLAAYIRCDAAAAAATFSPHVFCSQLASPAAAECTCHVD